MSKISELFLNFNKVKFDDLPHKYYIGDKQLTSVTTLIHKYEEEFDEEYWSDVKAQQFKLPQWQIKDAWRYINKKALLKGSLVHNFAENLFDNKIFPYPKDQVINELGYDPIFEEYLIQTGHVKKFYNDYYNVFIPIKTELVVCDEDYLIGGMVDLIVYNRRTKQYEIWDYKTNKEFTEESERYLQGTLSSLEASDIEIYSLQLNTYKRLIEKNTNIKIGGCYLVWLSHQEDTYHIFETKDRMDYVNYMLFEHKQSLNTK
jgi:hypothetical protein